MGATSAAHKAATEERDDRGKGQAKAQFDSISAMVERLNHARECTDRDCTEGQEGGDTWEDAQEYHDEEAARQVIEEDALSIEIRSDWHTPGDNEANSGEYNILLCTGGPACRIIGDLSEHNEPETARIEYQDWFTPWTEYREADESILLDYARCFYFGE